VYVITPDQLGQIVAGSTPCPPLRIPTDVIDPRIDVFAQRALLRMLKGDLATRTDATDMICAVKTGELAGIYKEDQRAPALRARKMNKGWWQLIPKGEDAVLFLDPGRPIEGPPMIVFRDGVRSLPARLDPAVQRAWETYKGMRSGRFPRGERVIECAIASAAGAIAGGQIMVPINNLVPTGMFCKVRAKSLGTTMTVKVAELPNDLAPAASEIARKWEHNFVRLNFGTYSWKVPIESTGVAHFPVPAAAFGQVSVFREGPHHQAVLWRASGTQIDTRSPNINVHISSRLRISLWASTYAIADPAQSPINDRFVRGAKGFVDDFTLNWTIVNDKKMECIEFDPADPVGIPKKGADPVQYRVRYYEEVLRLCHQLGIQVLAGYSLLKPESARTQAFNAWLVRLVENPSQRSREIRRVVQLIDDFLFSGQCFKGDVFDGIGFDLEAVPGQKKNISEKELDRRGGVLKEFYHELAYRLATRNKIVALAAYGLVDPTHWRGGRALNFGIAHQFQIALGAPNILIRPMGYDAPPRNDGENLATSKLYRWHKEIVDWALKGAKLHPSQFQLGIKQNWGGQNLGIVNNPEFLRRRCEELLRPNRLGLSVFALGIKGKENWRKFERYNDALNPGEAPPGTVGQPLQVPIGPSSSP